MLNAKLLQLESILLTRNPCAVSIDNLRQLSSAGLTVEHAYALLLASLFGLCPDEKDEDRSFVYDYLLPSVHHWQASDFERDLYLETIRFPEVALGDIQLTHAEFAAAQAFPCGDLFVDTLCLRAPLGFFTVPFGYPIMAQGGREWMTVTPNEIITMRPAIAVARGRVLVYGLGLGYYAFMVSQKVEVQTVTIVEREQPVISLFEKYLLPQFPNRQKITVVHDDAFAHAARTRFLTADGTEGEQSQGIGPNRMSFTDSQGVEAVPYDVVFTDLWHDAADGIPLYRRMLNLQHIYGAPTQHFAYWIEPTMRYYMDR